MWREATSPAEVIAVLCLPGERRRYMFDVAVAAAEAPRPVRNAYLTWHRRVYREAQKWRFVGAPGSAERRMEREADSPLDRLIEWSNDVDSKVDKWNAGKLSARSVAEDLVVSTNKRIDDLLSGQPLGR